MEDARQSLPGGSRSTSDTEALLKQIDCDKSQTRSLIVTAIEGSWIGYATVMGLLYRDSNTTATRQISSMADLRSALRDLPVLEDRIAALYFLTSYTRDVLYSQVMWGGTHQAAVEDYVMERMGAYFTTPRTEMQPGTKTCVGQLYGQVYNQKKHKLYASTLPSGTTLAVGCQEFKTRPHWKRPKEVYFVNTCIPSTYVALEQVNSKTVCTRVLLFLIRTGSNSMSCCFHHKDEPPSQRELHAVENRCGDTTI